MVSPVVLVVGSLHHDIMIEADHLPRRDETAVGRCWYPKFGGKGGNQAVAAARAGVGARMVGAVGRDAFGAFLLAALDRAGVDRRFVAELDGAGSGMSVAVQDAAGEYAATIVSGANLLINPSDLHADAVWEGVAVLVLQNEVTEALNLAAARIARARRLPVLLNAAPARVLSPELLAATDLLIVNAVEAEMMGTPPVSDLTSARKAAAQLAATVPQVVVTAGGHGLALAAGALLRDIEAEHVAVVSTHGAGDMFTGTLAAGLAEGKGLEDACRSAARAAAAHVAGRV